MKNKIYDIIKKKYPLLLFSNKQDSTKIDVPSNYVKPIISFCEDISEASSTVKITLIRESEKGIFFYVNEYNEKICNIIEKHEKNNLKNLV